MKYLFYTKLFNSFLSEVWMKLVGSFRLEIIIIVELGNLLQRISVDLLMISTVVCGDPPRAGNATVSGFPTIAGGHVTYQCNTGFSLIGGDHNLTCQDTGKYGGMVPVCKSELY